MCLVRLQAGTSLEGWVLYSNCFILSVWDFFSWRHSLPLLYSSLTLSVWLWLRLCSRQLSAELANRRVYWGIGEGRKGQASTSLCASLL